MKLAIVGSRNLHIEDFSKHLPQGITEIVSGGARGIDTQAAEYAQINGIALTEFLPEYTRFGKSAPLKRNEKIAEYADEALIFWDGCSKGTAYTIALFKRYGKPIILNIIKKV